MLKAILRIAAPVLIICSLVASSLGTVITSSEADAAEPRHNDIVRNGFTSRSQAVDYCKNNKQGFRTVLSYYDINCSQLSKASTVNLRSTAHERKLHSLGRISQGPKIARTGKATNEYSVKIGKSTFYMRNLWAWDTNDYSTYKVLKVKNGHGKTVYILYSCANVVTIGKYTPPAPPKKPKPQPVYSCDLLDVKKHANRRVVASVKHTVKNGAKFKDVTFDWGDGNKTRTTKTKDVSHQYDKAGEYSIKATVHFTVNGKERSHTAQTCVKKVKFEEKKPPVKPKKPNLEISKDVRVAPEAEWESVNAEAAPKSDVEYRITVTNTSEAELKNLHIHDTLPAGVTYDSDQVLQGSPEVTGKTLGDLIGDGITISSLGVGKSIEIRFTVTVDAQAGECEKYLNVARAKAKDVKEKQDDVRVKVCAPEVPEEPEVPEAPQPPQVEGEVTPPPAAKGELPKTGAAGALGIFSVTSFIGFAAYRLKEFFLAAIR